MNVTDETIPNRYDGGVHDLPTYTLIQKVFRRAVPQMCVPVTTGPRTSLC